jgi:hypothetical protein
VRIIKSVDRVTVLAPTQAEQQTSVIKLAVVVAAAVRVQPRVFKMAATGLHHLFPVRRLRMLAVAAAVAFRAGVVRAVLAAAVLVERRQRVLTGQPIRAVAVVAVLLPEPELHIEAVTVVLVS